MNHKYHIVPGISSSKLKAKLKPKYKLKSASQNKKYSVVYVHIYSSEQVRGDGREEKLTETL